MKKTLFLLEFRRTGLQIAALTTATLAVLFFVQVAASRSGGRSETDVRTAIDLVVLVVAAAAGLVVGVPTFCGESRRREIAFLEALPLDRAWIWALLVSSRIAASTLGFAIVVALRPWLLAGGRESLHLLGAVGCHVLFLAAGSCFGAAFRKLPFAFAATLLTTALVVFETAVGIPDRIADPLMVASRLVPLSAVFFGLSAWFVHRSELDLLRSRARNLTAIAVAAAAFVLALQQPPPRLGGDDRWMGGGGPGCVFAIANPRGGRTAGVAMFDTRTGNRLASVTVPAFEGHAFSADGERLWLIVRRSWPLRILDLVWPRGHAILAVRRDGVIVGPYVVGAAFILRFQPTANGGALVVAADESQAAVLELDATGNRPREKIVAPLAGFPLIREAGDRWLVIFANRREPSRAWLVNGEVTDTKPAPGEILEPKMVDGTLFPSRAAAAAALGPRYRVPPSELVLPDFRDSKHGWILRMYDGDADGYEGLDVLAPGTSLWEPIVPGRRPRRDSTRPARPVDRVEKYVLLASDLNAGIAAWLRSGSTPSGVVIRDLATGKTAEVGAGGPTDDDLEPAAEIRATVGGDRYAVAVTRRLRSTKAPFPRPPRIAVGNRAADSLTVVEPGVESREQLLQVDVEGNIVTIDWQREVFRLHLASGGVVDLVP